MFRRRLSTLLDSPVKFDNHLVWDGKKFPFYEAYDIILHHPKQVWTFFIRYALHHPSFYRHEAEASLLGLFADQKGTQVSLEKRFPLVEHDVVHADRFVTVGSASFSLAEAVGYIEQGDQMLRWELFFEDPTQCIHLYPRLLYSLPVPRLKFLSPRFFSFVSGQVLVNHRTRDVQHLKIFQSHRYGSQNSSPLVWIQCSHFDEDETAAFEALTIEPGWPRSSRKRWNFYHLIYQGQRYSVQDFWEKQRGTFLCDGQNKSIEFKFKKRGLSFECHVKRETPNAGLSVLAEVHIKIYKRQQGHWIEQGTLTSRAGGIVEECL